MIWEDVIIKNVVEFYIESADHNGLPLRLLSFKDDVVINAIEHLIDRGEISVNFGDIHMNPHIQAFEPHAKDVQLRLLKEKDLNMACLYPTRKVLKEVVKADEYSDRPYFLCLRLGVPQLELRFFKLSVLEYYRNDPRFYYDVTDYEGHIGLRSKHYESRNVDSSDKTFLRSFGFGYSEDLKIRVVVAFIRYLADMTPEHQRIWEANELSGSFSAHPAYIMASSGQTPNGVPIFIAFVEELKQINILSRLMDRVPLFSKDFTEAERPKDFGYLIRPTLREYRNFVGLLDKLMSENLNVKFFRKEINTKDEFIEKNGTRRVVDLGSISILEKWLSKYFQTDEQEEVNKMIECFRRVRKERQPIAHKIEQDEFSMKFLNQQRELIFDAYMALRTLRLILMNAPGTSAYSPPRWLSEAKFYVY